MKKILYITTLDITINAFLTQHIETLLSMGNVVDCACRIDKGIDKALLDKGVGVYNIPFTRNPLSHQNIRAFMDLIKIQNEKYYDIIHVHTPIAALYGRLLKLKFKSIKTIYTAHGFHFYKGAPKTGWLIYYPIEKIMARFTDITININQEDYEITKNRLKPKSCYLLHGVGLDLNKYKPLSNMERISKREKLNLRKDDFIIIMIGELNENKNQIQLIKAVELLKDKYSCIKVLIVGEGHNLHHLQKEVKFRSLENYISFLGYRSDINELINISDIGVLLSYREGLPRSLMELMANGKKVIATNIRGNRDLVCNENIGTLVDVGDYKATAEAIEVYYKNNIRKDTIPKEVETYSIRNILSELRLIYNNIP